MHRREGFGGALNQGEPTLPVNGLLHAALAVPDPAQGREFYEAFGLEAVDRGDHVAMRCVGRDQDQIVLLEAPEKRVHHYTFGTDADGLDELDEKLAERGIQATEEAPEGALDGGRWFRDLEGMWVNVRVADPAPPASYDHLPEPNSGRYRREDVAAWRSLPDAPRPRRLGHSLLFTSDVQAAQDFYADVLGLRLSDRILAQPPGAPDKIPVVAFMNVGRGDHHVFGFVQSSHRGFHHASFEVSGIDEMALGAERMAANGARMCFGLGRHAIGSNLFHYTRDPWGGWVEYFTDIDQVTERWEPNDWEAPVAVWGGHEPPEFFENLEPAS